MEYSESNTRELLLERFVQERWFFSKLPFVNCVLISDGIMEYSESSIQELKLQMGILVLNGISTFTHIPGKLHILVRCNSCHSF